jgi:hypothetical protein
MTASWFSIVAIVLLASSCAGGKTGDGSDVAGWRHRDGSAVSDREFAMARGACGQTATVRNPDAGPFDTGTFDTGTFDTTRDPDFPFLKALPPPPSSTDDAAQFEGCLDSKGIVPAP